MKKSISILMLLFVVGLAWGQFAGGSGTELDPWQITTAAELDSVHNFIGAEHALKHFILMNDIDLTTYLSPGNPGYNDGAFWFPIGDVLSEIRFYGKFHGNGKIISGLKINRVMNYCGLFGWTESGSLIENLGVIIDPSAEIRGAFHVGGLVGENRGTIRNCYVNGKIATAYQQAGGLVGLNNGYIKYSYSTGTVIAPAYSGGFVGSNWGNIQNCYNYSNVSRTSGSSNIDLGGFVGTNSRAILNCFSTGWVKNSSGGLMGGGFCGKVNSGVSGYQMTGNYWDTETSGLTTTVGEASGKTTSQMYQQVTFLDWDFDYIWAINENTDYPYLYISDQFPGGDGSVNYPWLITNAYELNNIRNYLGVEHSDKYFKLMNNIDLADYLSNGNPGYNDGAFWLPIGNVSDQFSGKLNGNNKTIQNLKINRPTSSDPIGLFGCIGNSGKIENLSLILDESGDITGKYIVSGLVGQTRDGTEISNCSVVGDIVGVSSGYSTGGLVGEQNTGGIITNCHTEGSVNGDMWVGGLVGYNNGKIESSYSQANVSSSGTDLGGLCGHNYWSGIESGVIENCYAGGSVSGGASGYVGGFVGNNNQGAITNCYSTGDINGGSVVGGFMGRAYGGTVSNSFWDTQTSGKIIGAGEVNSSTGTPTGNNTAEMKTINTFSAWDFGPEDAIWSMYVPSGGSISYPYLVSNAEVPAPGYEQLFAGGTGIISSPWEIETIAHLNNMRTFLGDDHSDKYFILNNDIDLTAYLLADGYNEGALWEPIGDNTDQFKGHFDGNKFKVTGLQINRPATDNVGLFAYIGSGATIQYLGVEVVESTSIIGNDYVGALAGQNHGSIEKCYVGGAGLISGNQSVGSLFGLNNGTVSETYTNTAVSAVLEAGGFTGKNTGTISNAFSTGDVSRISGESGDFGGFCGLSDGSTIQRCYSSGSVTYEGASDPDDKGFLGSAAGANGFSGNYFDQTASGQTNATQAVPEAASAKTSPQMRQRESFSGWNFSSIWNILEGQIRPFLSWEWEGVNLDGLIPARSMEYSSGIFTGSIDMDDDEVADITVKFTAPVEAGSTDLTFKYATNTKISSVQLLDNPENLSAYYYFDFADNAVLVNGLSFELEFPDDPENILYKQPGSAWQEVPSYAPAGFGKKAAPTSSGYTYTIDAAQLTLDESGTGEIEFAGEKGGDVPLSVRLTSFICDYQSGTVLLSWHTASETENAAFRIYRDEELITEIEGAGTTSEPHSYAFLDHSVIPGVGYTYVLADVNYTNDEVKHHDLAVTLIIPENEIPQEFVLENNYPNPFNPRTAISFQLSADSKVELSVYDMNGKMVAALVDDNLCAGYHTLNWDASDFSSGIYFYRLRARDPNTSSGQVFIDTKKMVFMK